MDDADLGRACGRDGVERDQRIAQPLGFPGQLGGALGRHAGQRSEPRATAEDVEDFAGAADDRPRSRAVRRPGRARPMIRMVGLGRRFGDMWAVRDLTLDVHAGEVIGLLGPNGAGKTTTVRMLAALIGPTEGEAQLDGHDVVTDAEAVRSRVGVLTETPGLYEKLSATENLDFFGKLHGLDRRRRRDAIERLLRLLGLWDRRSSRLASSRRA